MHYIIILGGIIIFTIFWTISLRQSLALLDENINNAMLQIGLQLSSRWEVLISLIDISKGYLDYDYISLIAMMEARRLITKKSSPEDINKQENTIAEIMAKISTVAENHPELKADKAYINTMEAVNQYENMLTTSRLIYNDCVSKMNRSIRMLPVFLIARMLGFSKRAYL